MGPSSPSFFTNFMVAVTKLVAVQGCDPCVCNGRGSSSLLSHPKLPPGRLLVKSPGFHPGARSSILRRETNFSLV